MTSIDDAEILKLVGRFHQLRPENEFSPYAMRDATAYGRLFNDTAGELLSKLKKSKTEPEQAVREIERVKALFVSALTQYAAEIRNEYSKAEFEAFDEWVRDLSLELSKTLMIQEAERLRSEPDVLAASSSLAVVSAADIQESEAEWLIDGFIPKGHISIIAGDGGTGKGYTVCDVIAGVTKGIPCMLDLEVAKGLVCDFSNVPIRDSRNVLYLSGEDTFEHTIVRRLRKAGADLQRVFTMTFTSQLENGITLDSDSLEAVIRQNRPDLLVLDPLEAFLSTRVRMAERNSMRQVTKILNKFGELYGLTTVLVCHTNKGKGVWGRKRLADSSDLWDIARSVLMVGWTPEKKRYIAHEKSNFGPTQKTIVFEIVDEHVHFCDYSDLGDREFVLAETWDNQGKHTRESAKDFILGTLEAADDAVPVKELDELADACGYSQSTLKRAKAELNKAGRIRTFGKNYGATKRFFIALVK